jgi:uncharacterized membrane protein YbhN (UPF0104 family)
MACHFRCCSWTGILIYCSHCEVMTQAPHMKKKALATLLKLVVSALLLALIVKKAGPHSVILRMRSLNGWLFLLSIAIYIVMSWIVAIRWRILLEGRYGVGKLFSLHMIGNFFNTILPSSMGGDAVKAYYLYRESKRAGISFGSVFLDRYVGLLARLSLGLVSAAFAFSELKSIGMQWAIPALFAVFTAGGLVVLRFRIGGRFGAVADFYDYVQSCLKRRMMMLNVFLLSLVIQTLLILMIATVARGIGQALSFTELFVFVPIIMTIMIIPVSISGFGIREGAFVTLFGLTGIPPSVSVTISFLWFLSTAAASLIGLVEYLRHRSVTT